jgi:hypothetical protein
MAAFQLTVQTAIRGYHVYKDVWTPTISEAFICQQERDKDKDSYAVAVHKEDGSDVLGHLPREFSRVAFLFLLHDGVITGEITSNRRYCHEKGGMEVPCDLTFVGKRKHIGKLKNYFQSHQFSCIEHIVV